MNPRHGEADGWTTAERYRFIWLDRLFDGGREAAWMDGGAAREGSVALASLLACHRFALAGASRSGRKFGNTLLRELRARGRQVTPLHPHAEAVEGLPCVRRLGDLPAPPEALVVCVPPRETPGLLREAAAAGVRLVWLQQGSVPPGAMELGRELGLEVVAEGCLLLHLEPVRGVHAVHRWLRRLWRRP